MAHPPQHRLASLIALAVSLSAPAATAEQTRSAVRDAVLARQMFDLGQARGDALLIIAAARLRKGSHLDPAETPVGSSAGPVTAGDTGPLDWQAMLDAAAPLVAGNPLLAGLADDVRAEQPRGVQTGARYWNAALGAGDSVDFDPLLFAGTGPAEVYVEGRSDADFNLYILGPDKSLVCADRDASRIAHCFWQPEGPAEFTIRVENLGPVTSDYALITN